MTVSLEPLPDGPRGRVLALALLAIVLGSLWVAVVAPLLDWYSARAETIAERRALLAHISGLAEALPALRQAANRAGTDGPDRTALLEGDSDAIAGAALQGMVQQMADSAGATLSSVETLPGEQRGLYRRIGLRVSLIADWPVIVDLLRSIETNRIRLLTDDLQLHAVAQADPSSSSSAPRIDTRLTIIGFRAGREAGTAPGPAPIGQQSDAGSPVDVALTGRQGAATR